MAELMTTDVRALLDRNPFDASAVADLREVLGRDPSRYATLRDAVAALRDKSKGEVTPDVHLRLGVGEVLLGKLHDRSSTTWASSRTSAWPSFSAAWPSNTSRSGKRPARPSRPPRPPDTTPRTPTSTAPGPSDGPATPRRPERCSRPWPRPAPRRPSSTTSSGSLLAAEGELVAASIELEKAIELDRHHTNALFELAYINDLHGNDDVALDFYKDCVKRPPVPLAALINLGVLYEDRMNFREAENCYRQVLAHDRTHPRAALFFKDCRASRDMFYDETVEKDIAIKRQLMEIPVTDFELSVRSRNCLRKMNIRTLGDLTRTTEAALLASKNFGETSLSEIKEMMTSKNLWLGMALEGGGQTSASTIDEPESLSAEDRAMLAKPIGDLNLSVRARKCMTKLGIQTLGELLSHTGDELLECKNFGVTSLNEVREKLRELNLKLKNE